MFECATCSTVTKTREESMKQAALQAVNPYINALSQQ